MPRAERASLETPGLGQPATLTEPFHDYLRPLPPAVVAVALGFLLKISAAEWLAVVVSIAFVLALEAINTALEFLTDLVSPHIHPLARDVKDVAAGAVLVAAMGAAVVGAIIFLPKIWGIFF